MTSFFGELKRRNVVKVAVAYAIVGWVLIEVASVLLPTFQAPEWVMRVFSFFVIAGFPVALVLSWAYDLTPDGIERTKSDPLPQTVTRATGRKLDFAIIGALVLALGFVVYNYESEDAPASTPETVVDEVADTAPVVVEEQRERLPNSIAVLPLASISPDPSDAYFAVGIHDEILSQLAKIRDLNVIARTSVLGYPASGKSIPEIADELNVEMVMEGSVRIAGDNVRVTVQLIDGATNTHLWTEVYPGTLSDIFAIQSDIATRIAMALEAELLPSERESIQRQATNSTEAYGFYLRAMATWGNDPANIASPTLRANIESYLDQAIETDPDFALAYAQRARFLADSLNSDIGTQENYVSRRQELENLALTDLETALAIDPSLGAAYGTLATIHQYNWRGAEAEAAYERALELSPNDTDILSNYAYLLGVLGRHEEALGLSRRAVELDPNNSNTQNTLAGSYSHVGDLDAAVAAQRRALELSPIRSSTDLARLEVMRGNRAVALEELPVAERLVRESTNPHFLALIAYIYGQIDQRDEAERILAVIEQSSPDRRIAPGVWALLYLAIDDQKQALDWLTEAADNPQPYESHVVLMWLKINIWQDPVLDQPEFVAVRSRLGFRE